MKRLRDTPASSPLLQKVHSLLDAAPPLSDSPQRRLRVRAALDRAPARRGGLLRVPAIAAAALVALFGASAFAAVRIYEAIERPAAQPADATATEAAAVRKARRAAAKRKAAEVAKVATAEQGAAEPAPEPMQVHALAAHADAPGAARSDGERATGARTAARRAKHAQSAAGSREGARRVEDADLSRSAADTQPLPATAPAGSDSELVHRALKALRRDGDPALAARLLSEHRARSPRGPLAEEALSLQVEAALALRSPRAATLAREYMARYPDGRYAGVAARALQEAPP